MIAKPRLDALTDGVFAVAMTLLVIDLKLPDSAQPHSPRELLASLADLEGQFSAYALSFAVLGLRWLSVARSADPGETAPKDYAGWTLVHLFFVTCIPFSTMIVGRYGNLTPAVWLYAGNMMAAAVAALRLGLHGRLHDSAFDSEWTTDLAVIIAASIAAIALSPYIQSTALWLYALTALPPILRWQRRMTE